jgi:glycosyltransferase involved in cell wall biosynthesis
VSAQLVACYAAWNEEQLIAESMRSVKEYVDRFVVVDAVFETNEVDAVGSTDRQREVVEAVAAPKPLTYLSFDHKVPEHEARNRYLEELADGDWALVIDGDEVLYGAHEDVQRLVDRIKAGELDGDAHHAAVGVWVLTQMLRFAGSAPEVTAEAYATGPIVCSGGWMARLFRADAGLRYPALPSNRGLFRDGAWVGQPAERAGWVFLVNHHLRQSHAEYVADHRWLAQVRPGMGGPA